MSLDPTKFASGMRVTRHAKETLDDQGRPTRWNSKPWKANQVVLEDSKYIYVSRQPVGEGTAIPRMVEIVRGWTLVEAYAGSLVGSPSLTPGRGLGAIKPWNSDDLDRGLQVACDMGRWDIAYMMVVEVWGLGEVGPADVLWDTFPHISAMSVVSGGRLFVPAGLTRTVVENWWAWQGGYHNPRGTLWTDWDEYGRVMAGLRNPFKLGAVPANLGVLQPSERPVGQAPRALDPAELAGREWWWGQGVAYLANARGTVLPYWYVTGDQGATGHVEELAWGADVRNKLSRQMNLPVLIARRSSIN